jgi:hypothetical protein
MVGDTLVAVPVVPQCRVCRSPFRVQVDQGLASGLSPVMVVDRLPSQACLRPRNVREHRRRGHLPADPATVQTLAATATDMMTATGNVESIVVSAAAEMVLAQRVLQVVFERLVSGEIEPSIRDGLRAARLVHEIEQRRLPPNQWSSFRDPTRVHAA